MSRRASERSTLSLHDALPIFLQNPEDPERRTGEIAVDELARLLEVALGARLAAEHDLEDRKSTRLNSSHPSISYAVFCLKKKKSQPGGRHDRPRSPKEPASEP